VQLRHSQDWTAEGIPHFGTYWRFSSASKLNLCGTSRARRREAGVQVWIFLAKPIPQGGGGHHSKTRVQTTVSLCGIFKVVGNAKSVTTGAWFYAEAATRHRPISSPVILVVVKRLSDGSE
jgi:hypothetical protein